jgi:hypothetical protein
MGVAEIGHMLRCSRETLGSTYMLQVERVLLKAKPFVEVLSIVRTATGDGCQWMEHSKSA